MRVRPELRLAETCDANEENDARTHDFDLQRLEPGDPVEVLIPSEARWIAGVMRIADEGAWIDFAVRDPVSFADAVTVGLRRVLH